MGENTSDTTSKTPPETIYHYCDMSGLYGMVRSNQLWLSNAYFMNDYMEHKWLFTDAYNRFKELVNKSDEKLFEFLGKYVDLVNVYPYIACFSSEPDLLSQWRGYADDGAGFAIGFSTNCLFNDCDQYLKNEIPIRLQKVDYNLDSQKHTLDSAIERYVKDLREEDLLERTLRAFAEIWTIAAICKNPAFCEEREYRIILMPKLRAQERIWPLVPDVGTSEIQFRVIRGRIIPYYTFSFSREAITEIRLGPKNYARESPEQKFALKMLLMKNSYDPDRIKIINSGATYC